jgi:hypothetical protein
MGALMPRLRGIPPRARVGLKRLLALDSSTKEHLIQALRQEGPALHTGALTTALRDRLRLLSDSEIEEIVDSLVSLSYGQTRADVGVKDFVAELVQLDEVAVPPEKRSETQAFLEGLLSTKAISGTAKVNDVITESERLFLGARIITDIRPIFGDSPTETLGAAIVHMLKITYHSALEDLDFYVSLDEEDLGTLREVLGRAEAKARSMRSVLEKSGLKDFHNGGAGR